MRSAALLAKSVAPLFMRQFLISLMSFAASTYFARQFSVSEYAIFSNALILNYFLFAIGDGTLYIPLMSRDWNPKLLSTYFWLHILICFSVSVVIMVFAEKIGSVVYLSGYSIRLFALSLIIMPVQAVNQFRFEKTGNFVFNSINEVIQTGVFLITFVLIFKVSASKDELGIAYLARALSGAAGAISFGRFFPSAKIERLDKQSILNSLRLVSVNMFGFANSVASPVVLGSYFNKPTVASINWVNSNMQYIQQPFLVMNRFLIPRFSNPEKVDNREKIYSIGTLLYFSVAVLVYQAIDAAVYLIYGERWTAYVPLFKAVLLTTLLIPISTVTGALAVSSGRSGLILALNIVRALLFWFTLILCSLRGLGAWSFVIAQAIAETVHIPTFFIINGERSGSIAGRYMGMFLIAGAITYVAQMIIPQEIGVSMSLLVAAIIAGAFAVTCLVIHKTLGSTAHSRRKK